MNEKRSADEPELVDDIERTFGDRSFRLRHVLTSTMPDLAYVATAIGIAFYGEQLVLVEHAKYGGLQPPGGHLEPGETPVDALRREVLEEAAGEVGKATFIGYEEITPLFDVPANYRYSVPSYQVYFACTVERLLPFEPNAEALARHLLPVDAARVSEFGRTAGAFYERALVVSSEGPPDGA